MTPDEREYITGRVQAAWPYPAIADATALLWAEHLTPLDYPTAHKAVARLEKSSLRQPSLAEFHEAYRAATPTPISMQIESPVDKSGLARVREMTAWLREPHGTITTKELDAAGVTHWRERLRDALADDLGQRGKNYDAAWSRIRVELGRDALVLPDGRIFA